MSVPAHLAEYAFQKSCWKKVFCFCFFQNTMTATEKAFEFICQILHLAVTTEREVHPQK